MQDPAVPQSEVYQAMSLKAKEIEDVQEKLKISVIPSIFRLMKTPEIVYTPDFASVAPSYESLESSVVGMMITFKLRKDAEPGELLKSHRFYHACLSKRVLMDQQTFCCIFIKSTALINELLLCPANIVEKSIRKAVDENDASEVKANINTPQTFIRWVYPHADKPGEGNHLSCVENAFWLSLPLQPFVNTTIFQQINAFVEKVEFGPFVAVPVQDEDSSTKRKRKADSLTASNAKSRKAQDIGISEDIAKLEKLRMARPEQVEDSKRWAMILTTMENPSAGLFGLQVHPAALEHFVYAVSKHKEYRGGLLEKQIAVDLAKQRLTQAAPLEHDLTESSQALRKRYLVEQFARSHSKDVDRKGHFASAVVYYYPWGSVYQLIECSAAIEDMIDDAAPFAAVPRLARPVEGELRKFAPFKAHLNDLLSGFFQAEVPRIIEPDALQRQRDSTISSVIHFAQTCLLRMHKKPTGRLDLELFQENAKKYLQLSSDPRVMPLVSNPFACRIILDPCELPSSRNQDAETDTVKAKLQNKVIRAYLESDICSGPSKVTWLLPETLLLEYFSVYGY